MMIYNVLLQANQYRRLHHELEVSFSVFFVLRN